VKELGRQLIVELYDCDTHIINNINLVEKVLLEAANKSKATVVEYKFHKFAPHGVSGVIIIAESHFSIHTWPEYGYCAIDIFTCGDLIDNPLALKIIKEGLRAKTSSVIEMKRGILDLPDDQIRHNAEGA